MSFMWIVAISSLVGMLIDNTMGYAMDLWLYLKVRDKSEYKKLSKKLDQKTRSDLDLSDFPVWQQMIIVFLVVIITYTLWPIGGIWAAKEVAKDYRKVYADWKRSQAS